jgi:hypothetical protein
MIDCYGGKKIKIVVSNDGSFSIDGITNQEFGEIFPNSEIVVDQDGSIRIKNIYDAVGVGACTDIRYGSVGKYSVPSILSNSAVYGENTSIEAYISGDGVVSTVADGTQPNSWALSGGILARSNGLRRFFGKGGELPLHTPGEIAESLTEQKRSEIREIVYDFSIVAEPIDRLLDGVDNYQNLQRVVVLNAGDSIFDDLEAYARIVQSDIEVLIHVYGDILLLSSGGVSRMLILPTGGSPGYPLDDTEKVYIRRIVDNKAELSLGAIEFVWSKLYGYKSFYLPIAVALQEIGADYSGLDFILPDIGKLYASLGIFYVHVSWYRYDEYEYTLMDVGVCLGVLSRLTGGMAILGSCVYADNVTPIAFLTGYNVITNGNCYYNYIFRNSADNKYIFGNSADNKLYIDTPLHWRFDDLIGKSIVLSYTDADGNESEEAIMPFESAGIVYAVSVNPPAGHVVLESSSYHQTAEVHAIHRNAERVEAFQKKPRSDDFNYINPELVNSYIYAGVDALVVSTIEGDYIRNRYEFSNGYGSLDIQCVSHYPSMILWAKFMSEVTGHYEYSYATKTLSIGDARDYVEVARLLDDRLEVLHLTSEAAYSSGTLPVSLLKITVPTVSVATYANLLRNAWIIGAPVELVDGGDLDVAILDKLIEDRGGLWIGRFSGYALSGEGHTPTTHYIEGTPGDIMAKLGAEVLNRLDAAGVPDIEEVSAALASLPLLFDRDTMTVSGCIVRSFRFYNHIRNEWEAKGGAYEARQSFEDAQEHDELKEVLLANCDTTETFTWVEKICEFSANLDTGDISVAVIATEEIRMADVVKIMPDDDWNCSDDINKTMLQQAPKGEHVIYTIEPGGDGEIVVHYAAYDADGNDITDQYKTITVDDGFYYLGGE